MWKLSRKDSGNNHSNTGHMHHPQRIAAGCDRVLKPSRCQEMSGKPDAGKLARPVWGWGRGAIPGLHHAEGGVG
jgi:hypothetical protein